MFEEEVKAKNVCLAFTQDQLNSQVLSLEAVVKILKTENEIRFENLSEKLKQACKCMEDGEQERIRMMQGEDEILSLKAKFAAFKEDHGALLDTVMSASNSTASQLGESKSVGAQLLNTLGSGSMDNEADTVHIAEVQSKSEEFSATEKANSVLIQQKTDDENLWMSKMKDEQEKNNEMKIVLQNKIEEVLAAEVEKNILIQEKTEADRKLEVVKAEQEHERKQLSKLKDDLDSIKIDLQCAINEKEDAVKTVCAKEAIILDLKSNADKIKDLDLLKTEQEFRNAKISSLEEGMENIMADLENVNIEKDNALEKVKAQEAIIQEQTEEKAEILKLLQSKAEELYLSEKAKCVLQQKVDDESQWMLKMKDEQEKNNKMNIELQNKIEF